MLAYLAMTFILQLTCGSEEEINAIAQKANFNNIGAREIELAHLMVESGEHNGVSSVGVSRIYVEQDAFSFGTELFDSLQITDYDHFYFIRYI